MTRVSKVNNVLYNVSYPNEFWGQSYKYSTIVNFVPRVVPDLKIAHITTLDL